MSGLYVSHIYAVNSQTAIAIVKQKSQTKKSFISITSIRSLKIDRKFMKQRHAETELTQIVDYVVRKLVLFVNVTVVL